MVKKPADLLNQLPSVSELLEKPPIRALADRWNRSVVAGNVRSFLEEMRSELRRRAADLPMPSVRELADRAARYIVSERQKTLGTAINATGRIWGAPWSNRPLGDAAQEHMFAVGRDFALAETTAQRMSEFESLVCRIAGGQAAAVVHSYTGALWLALATLAGNREVLVSRAEIDEIESAEPLPKVASAAGVTLKEVGTTNRAPASDYEAAISPRTAALLRISSDAYRVVGEIESAETEELVALARDREIPLIEALGAAPIVDRRESFDWPRLSARSSLAKGIDLIVIRGDGMIGGPPSGILIGSEDAIRRVKDHPLFGAWKLDSLRLAALMATLECYENTEPSPGALPIWQIVDTPVENLHNRAERMAAQLEHAEQIGSAAVVELRSQLFPSLSDGQPSYGVALIAANGDIKSLEDRLRSASVPIVGRLDGDRLLLDLRTVVPRQDKILVDELLDSTTASLSAHDANEGQAAEPLKGEVHD